MNQNLKRFSLGISIAFICIAALFQNCGPAKINGSPTGESALDQASTVGAKVDLASLLNSPSENAANIIYTPQTFAAATHPYAEAEPIFENVILKSNDFTRIEWVQESSSQVIAGGTVFSQKTYSQSLSGKYYIFGYRNENPFLIGQVTLADKSSTSLSVSSVGAVTVSQKLVDTVLDNQSYLIEVAAPNVDLRSIRMTNQTTGEVIESRRALLVQKKLVDSLQIEISLSDKNGQSFSKIVSLAATAPAPALTSITTTTTTTTTPAPPAPTTTTTTTTTLPVRGLYNIKSQINSSFCADIDSSSAVNGARLYIWSCLPGNPNQAFTFNASGELRVHGRCLDATNAVAGAQLQINDCNGSAVQKFAFDSSNGMIRGANNQCVDVYAGNMVNRTYLNMYTCNPNNMNQKFSLAATTCSPPAWIEFQQYDAGSVVTYQGQIYIANFANPGYIPTVSTYYWSVYTGCASN